MSYATLDELRSHLGGSRVRTPEYIAKMLHPLPPFKAVDRVAFILKHCEGKRVLDFGASGPLSDDIRRVAADYVGVDREASDGVVAMNLDRLGDVPLGFYHYFERGSIDIIVCGEVLEHLGNPLDFLDNLRESYAGIPTIITVPNAFGATAQRWLRKGQENVNSDHVAWYSPKTLSVLLERAGYKVGDLYWYGGTDYTAEGLLVVTE